MYRIGVMDSISSPGRNITEKKQATTAGSFASRGRVLHWHLSALTVSFTVSGPSDFLVAQGKVPVIEARRILYYTGEATSEFFDADAFEGEGAFHNEEWPCGNIPWRALTHSPIRVQVFHESAVHQPVHHV